MLENITLSESAPLSLTSLVINLLIGALISVVLKYHYKKFGSTLTNREEFGSIFPFILLTTVLVISIVKSSLALSLGLVGALSIVRFRTPIKEPEELAYLFISIAAGLGLGANQTIPTVLSIIIILAIMSLVKLGKNSTKEKNMFITIEHNLLNGKTADNIINNFNKIIENEVGRYDLRRLDVRKETIDATYLININNMTALENIVKKFQDLYPGISITYLDQNQVPSI
jgi:uncharacterized membrane protein YhiD involved in acid resistance